MKGTATGCKPPFALKLVRTSCIALLGVQPAVLAAALPVALQAPAAIAQVQSAEAVAKLAQAITVRIEGATQGSGVLVKREGNRYTVLTAWHVVSGQRPGEELDVYTPDGQKHQVERGSVKHIGDVDMAVLDFMATAHYKVASINSRDSQIDFKTVVISGYPSHPASGLKYSAGLLETSADIGLDQGVRLFYSANTLSGMSGGPILLAPLGLLVGIHARGELDEVILRHSGVEIKTGLNQGVPINYYIDYLRGVAVQARQPLPAAPLAKWDIEFQAARLPESDFAIVASNLEDASYVPRGYSRQRILNVIRQLSPARSCWKARDDDSVQIDLKDWNWTGVCARFVNANGYSVRMRGVDFQQDSDLVLEQEGPYVVLYTKNRFTDQVEPIPVAVARTRPESQESSYLMKLLPGWRLEQREFNGRKLGHVYFSHD